MIGAVIRWRGRSRQSPQKENRQRGQDQEPGPEWPRSRRGRRKALLHLIGFGKGGRRHARRASGDEVWSIREVELVGDWRDRRRDLESRWPTSGRRGLRAS